MDGHYANLLTPAAIISCYKVWGLEIVVRVLLAG